MNWRRTTFILIFLPAWVPYLLALCGWGVTLGLPLERMYKALPIEFLALIAFPFLGGIAFSTSRAMAWRIARWPLFALLIAVYTAIAADYGRDGIVIFWLGAGLTYFGWLWSPPEDQHNLALIVVRWLTVLFLYLAIFPLAGGAAAIFAGGSPGLAAFESWFGLLYFLMLQLCELTGAYDRILLRLEKRARFRRH